MLTANDIRNTSFSKGMGGYKTAEVDVFKEQCADTVAELSKSKAELEKKLEVLADKLMEYRNDEDNIRSALLNAQRLGDSIVREAKQKAGLMMDDAKIKAENMQEVARRSIAGEEHELERIRREVTNFKTHLLSIYREHLALIDVLPELKEEKPGTEPEKEADAPAPEKTDAAVKPEQESQPAASPAVQPTAQSEQPPASPSGQSTGQPAQILQPVFESAGQSAAPSDMPPETPNVVMNIPVLPDDDPTGETADGTAARGTSSVSRYGNLKFGDDYDISKDNDYYKRKK